MGQKGLIKGGDGVMLIGFHVSFNLHVGNVEAVRRFLNGVTCHSAHSCPRLLVQVSPFDCKGSCGIGYLI